MTAPQTVSWYRRCRRQLLTVIVIVLTAVAGGACLWTLHTRQTGGPAVPVAVINSDRPVTTGSGKDEKTVAAGRQLAAGLVQPPTDEETPLAWQLVDASDAARGLRDGRFYAVLTIPPSFSAAVTSTSGHNPETAQLQLVSNDASSAAVAGLAQIAVTQAAASLSDQATRGFVDRTLASLTSISTNLTSTAAKAQQLADSSHQVADSSGDLSDGAASLSSGADDLFAGAADAAAGANQVASAASDVNTAAGRLARGARRSASGAADASAATARLASGNQRLTAQTEAQATGLRRLGRATARVEQGSSRVADQARQVALSCPPEAGPRYCKQVRRLALASRAEARAVAAVDTGVHDAARRADRIAGASNALATASARVADGTEDLARATRTVATAAGQLDQATGSLASGATASASGTTSLASGAKKYSQAAGRVASGARQLDDANGQLADGADSLAKGLRTFAKTVPAYTDQERTRLADVVTTPVAVQAGADHDASVEASLTPLLLGAGLWLASLMMFLTRGAVPLGSVWAQSPPARRVLAGWLPTVGTGAALTVVLLALIAVFNIPIRSPLATGLFGGLGVLAFAATNQALVALFGSVGRLLGVVFTVVQVIAVGGLVPIQTAPAFIQTLHQVLPLPRFVDGASQLILGGSSANLLGSCAVLLVWTAAGLIVSIAVTTRLRPTPSTYPVRPSPQVAAPTVDHLWSRNRAMRTPRINPDDAQLEG